MATITDDDDLKALRASSWALEELKRCLPEYIESSGHEKTRAKEDGSTKQVQNIVDLLNIFQEDPQLLDPHLKELLPSLTAKLADVLSREDVTLLNDLSKIIYHFCKVRGAKVVTRFFDNEPQYLHPSLQLVNTPEIAMIDPDMAGTAVDVTATADNVPSPLSWEARYVLLLWVAHLMLTPFDLASVSELAAAQTLQDADLPPQLPAVALEVLTTCTQYLSAASNEQSAACTALVKLALRPDMRKLSLLDAMLRVSMANFSSEKEDLHTLNGQLMFLNGIISSANANDIHQHLLPIFELVNSIFYQDTDKYTELRSSAVSKKLAIKIQRNLISQILQHERLSTSTAQAVSTRMLQELGALEDVIDFLLKCLADRDTQVRHAASKALSVLTTKLDREMAEEVVEAVLGSLNENVFRDPETSSLSTSAVNPVRWHGLTLTLSHMLFRRSPGPEQLNDVLQALYNTLSFEQRSATGNSLGSNVRDAANFGLWSLARRYSTKELLAVKLDTGSSEQQTTIQRTACHLLVAACLDPAGNIRRGSSAALQELIGRHPDTIIEGISLVQTVDYHAVGLRERAVIDVAFDAARLSDLYREVLLEGMSGWRGIRAPDPASRGFAATAIGCLANMESATSVTDSFETFRIKLTSTTPRDVEYRHGLILTLAAIIDTFQQREILDDILKDVFVSIAQGWSLFDSTIAIEARDLLTPSMRSDLTIDAILALMNALASCQARCRTLHIKVDTPNMERVIAILNICLSGKTLAHVAALPETCKKLMEMLSVHEQQRLVETWLKVLESKPTLGTKEHGVLIALGSILKTFSDAPSSYKGPCDRHAISRIHGGLVERAVNAIILATSAPDVDVRVVAMRSLALTIEGRSICSYTAHPSNHMLLRGHTDHRYIDTLERGLNDYTINERGDVGSLVRFESLLTVNMAWTGIADPTNLCLATVQRLALERLDKVRMQAAKCLKCQPNKLKNYTEGYPDPSNVSTYDYFTAVGTCILKSASFREDAASNQLHIEAFLAGFASSAGAGAESLIETSRQALHDLLCTLPLYPSTINVGEVTLSGIAFILSNLLSAATATSNDRILLPLLTTLAFLLDAHVLHPLLASESPSSLVENKPPTPLQLLSLTQKAHYKSTSLPKLLICIDIYRSLSELDTIRAEVLKKLVSMLLHPFPRVRVAAAEALWVACMVSDKTKDALTMLGQWKWAENVDVHMKEAVRVIRGNVLG